MLFSWTKRPINVNSNPKFRKPDIENENICFVIIWSACQTVQAKLRKLSVQEFGIYFGTAWKGKEIVMD